MKIQTELQSELEETQEAVSSLYSIYIYIYWYYYYLL